MKVAYLIDRDAVGGGNEYIRQLQNGLPVDATVLFSAKGECSLNKVLALRPDILHVNHLKALLSLLINPFVKIRIPIVFTVHGIHLRQYEYRRRTLRNRVCRRLRLLTERWLYSRCQALIALTDTDARYLRDVYRTQTKICVIPNGVSHAEIPMKEKVPENRLLDEKYEYISIGRCCFPKGQDILLAAVAKCQVVLRAKSRKVLVIGGGCDLSSLVAFADHAGIRDLVTFVGEIEGASALLHVGRILICPSRWEGFPLLLCEAGWQKKFVIASDCAGNRDIICSGESGLLFPIEDVDSLSDLMSLDYSDDYVTMMGEALHGRIKRDFNVERMLSATLELYRELVEKQQMEFNQ